jgi:cAMP-dependent protein kinase regulator
MDIWICVIGRTPLRKALEAAYRVVPWRDRVALGEFVFRGGEGISRLHPRADGDLDPESRMRAIPLFRDLPEAGFRTALSRAHLEHFAPGEDVVREGERGDRMYVIAGGTAEVLARDVTGAERPKARLRAGDYFGQVALLRDCPRTATVRAASSLWAFSLSRDDVHDIWPETGREKKSEEYAVKMNRLHDLPIFRSLPPADLDLLAEQARFRSCAAGEVIIREEDPSTEFFIVDSGRVRVTQDGSERRTLGPGEFFGEIALLFDVPRTASVIAMEECRVLALPGDIFRRIVARRDGFRSALANVGEERLASD